MMLPEEPEHQGKDSVAEMLRTVPEALLAVAALRPRVGMLLETRQALGARAQRQPFPVQASLMLAAGAAEDTPMLVVLVVLAVEALAELQPMELELRAQQTQAVVVVVALAALHRVEMAQMVVLGLL
jgi:hypothetical protein